MSHRSHRSSDRDRISSNHSYKYDKYEHRHRRDDSRDRCEYYYSKKSSKRESRSRYRSRSHSPHHSSKNQSRHHRSRSKSSHRHDTRRKDKDTNEKHSDSSEHFRHLSNDKFHQLNQYDATNQKTDKQMSIEKTNATEHLDEMDGIISNENDAVLEEEKQRIQQETLKRLQKHLAKEGKKYPPPKPQASHPIFANDGSFLEMFKSMQGNLQPKQPTVELNVVPATSNSISRVQPIKRRGAKILKTGIVQKAKAIEDTEETQPSDSWNAYLKEVKRYKTVTCSDENMTRSLVK